MEQNRSDPPGAARSSTDAGKLGDPRVLLQRVRERDAEARNALLAHCYPRILRMVQARLGPKLRQAYDPTDIVQDTMLEACQRLDGLNIQELGQLINWLGKIAHHRITGAARALDRLPAAFSSLVTPSATSAFPVPERSSVLSPSARASRDDELERLFCALDSLEEREREVICLRDFAEASWTLIAQELGFQGPSGASMLYGRAWRSLSEKLGRSTR